MPEAQAALRVVGYVISEHMTNDKANAGHHVFASATLLRALLVNLALARIISAWAAARHTAVTHILRSACFMFFASAASTQSAGQPSVCVCVLVGIGFFPQLEVNHRAVTDNCDRQLSQQGKDPRAFQRIGRQVAPPSMELSFCWMGCLTAAFRRCSKMRRLGARSTSSRLECARASLDLFGSGNL